MKIYRLSATAIDDNGVEVTSTNAETLGNCHGVTFLSLAAAEAAREEAQEGIDDVCPDWQAEVVIEEAEIDRLEEGETYDIAGAEFVGWTKGDGSGSDGYNVADYFDREGRYLGADEHGIEPIFAE